MIASALTPAPKLRPACGTPPITPGSAVSVMYFRICSSLATEATPSGMPMPRLTTPPGGSSNAPRRAIILRSSSGSGGSEPSGTRISEEKAGMYGAP